MLRAILVARSMSFDAPVVTLSSPKISSSATRPPYSEHSWDSIATRFIEYLSPSGRYMVTPSARPRGMMVTL